MKLSRVNTGLLLLIVLINSYIIVLPFAPNILFWWQSHHGHVSQQLHHTLHHSPTLNNPVPQENRLIVPSMQLDQEIFDGKTMTTLRKGLWRRPNTSTPSQGGNTVIVGHRFTYTNPRGTFYSLDKVKPGDEIGVWWSGKRYLYKVREVKQVKARITSVEAPTDKPTLTLYTCTPLWLPKDRLIVIAEQENNP